jgi:hypothetical protein
MPHLELSTTIRAAPEVCFDLSLDVEVHTESTGAREEIIGGVRSGGMRLGDTVTWRARHYGIPFTMTSKIIELERPLRFVDEQVRGPIQPDRARDSHARHRRLPKPARTPRRSRRSAHARAAHDEAAPHQERLPARAGRTLVAMSQLGLVLQDAIDDEHLGAVAAAAVLEGARALEGRYLFDALPKLEAHVH